MMALSRPLFRAVAIAAGVMIFSGCTSTPKSYYNADPNVDFTRYESYGFLENLSTDNKDYQSMVSNFLKVAVAQQLDLLGMDYSNSPDILVNFYVHTKEKIKSRNVPTTSAYYGYRSPYYNTWGGYGGYETRIDQYTEGTLNIDIIDAKSHNLVWEGFMTGRVTDKKLQELEKTVDNAVRAIMKGYPPIQ